MNRRQLLLAASGYLLADAARPVLAQRTRRAVPVVAVLAPSTRVREEVTLLPFYDEMRHLGWIEGQTVLL